MKVKLRKHCFASTLYLERYNKVLSIIQKILKLGESCEFSNFLVFSFFVPFTVKNRQKESQKRCQKQTVFDVFLFIFFIFYIALHSSSIPSIIKKKGKFIIIYI